jgi:hypothetical protein
VKVIIVNFLKSVENGNPDFVEETLLKELLKIDKKIRYKIKTGFLRFIRLGSKYFYKNVMVSLSNNYISERV